MNTKIKIPWIFKCILTLVYAGIIYWESSKDTSSVSLPYHTDKLVHFAEFGLFMPYDLLVAFLRPNGKERNL